MTHLEFERRKRGLRQTDLGNLILYDRAVISNLERLQPEPAAVGKRLRAALEGFFGEPLEKLLSPVGEAS
ncbi:MAG: hypothetical protein ACLQPD_31205 [Desulfomonilaceae bacterium]